MVTCLHWHVFFLFVSCKTSTASHYIIAQNGWFVLLLIIKKKQWMNEWTFRPQNCMRSNLRSIQYVKSFGFVFVLKSYTDCDCLTLADTQIPQKIIFKFQAVAQQGMRHTLTMIIKFYCLVTILASRTQYFCVYRFDGLKSKDWDNIVSLTRLMHNKFKDFYPNNYNPMFIIIDHKFTILSSDLTQIKT